MLISIVAISLSLVTAALVLVLLGAPISILLLVGLVMALGIVIDDAANDVRHIRRRLREHRVASTETTSKSTVAVVLEAALERRSAIGYATLIALVAVVPVFLLTGLAARIFKPLVLAYVAAVVASTVVALTVTTALSPIPFRNTARGTRVPSHPVAAAPLRRRARGSSRRRPPRTSSPVSSCWAASRR